MTKKEQLFYLLPEWKITQSAQELTVSGGADAKYTIELENSEVSFFSSLSSGKEFARIELSVSDQRILEQLLTAEIIVPILAKSKLLRVFIIGDIKLNLPSNLAYKVVAANEPHDISLITRSTSTYAELLSAIDYRTVTKPHILIDLAFHHTLSVGPLVFPGETACLYCLEGRINSRWGEEQPQESSLTSRRYLGVATELITTELERIAQGDTSLTNKTVAWNFLSRTIKINQLLKVPICPVCTANKIDHNGALALPW